MKFDFYFKRTCFRTMTLYYKTALKPFFEKCRSRRKKQPFSSLIEAALAETHPQLLTTMANQNQKDNLLSLL
jgi:hypothetical protein